MVEADRLEDVLRRHGEQAVVGLCGGDPVSRDAARAFNERIGAFLVQYRAHLEGLRAGGQALDATARAYGHTEAQITASYQSISTPDWQRAR